MNLESRLTASINVNVILKGGKSWNDKLIKLRYRKVPHYGRVNFMEQLLIAHNLGPNSRDCLLRLHSDRAEYDHLSSIRSNEICPNLINLKQVFRRGYKPRTINFPYYRSRIRTQQHLAKILGLSGDTRQVLEIWVIFESFDCHLFKYKGMAHAFHLYTTF